MLKQHYARHKKMYLILAAMLLTAGLVWAAAELSGQANAKSAEAAEGSAEIEMVTLDTIKQPKPKKKDPPPCDWQAEKRIRHAIKANDKGYKQLLAKVKAEVRSQGKVSDATKGEVMNSAQGYNQLQNEYADMWQQCNCKTRSKLARKLADSRLKNAEVAVSEIDEEKLKEMDKAQEEVRQARREYAVHAKENDEISDEDKKEIQAKVVPEVEKMAVKLKSLLSSVTALMKEVQSTASSVKSGSSGGLGGLLGSVKKLAATGPKLLTQVKTLLGVVESLSSNVNDLQADTAMLTEKRQP